MKTRIEASVKGSTIDIAIYDTIGDGYWGGTSPKGIIKALQEAPKATQINVRINSPGGSVFDGTTIYNLLAQHDANVTVNVDGYAASAASLVAMAGDEIIMAKNAMMMIHDPWTISWGSAKELREDADLLEKIELTLVDTYAARTGQTPKTVAAMMEAETWMNADEALDKGFATEVVEAKKAAAFVGGDLSRFKNIPQAALDAIEAGETLWTKAAAMLGLKDRPSAQPERKESAMTTEEQATPAAPAAPGLTAEQQAEIDKQVDARLAADTQRRNDIADAIGDFPEVVAAAQADPTAGVTEAKAMAFDAAKTQVIDLTGKLAASELLVKAAAEAGVSTAVDTGDEEDADADFAAELRARVASGMTEDAAMVAMARKYFDTAGYDEWIAGKQKEIPNAKSQQ